MGDFLELWEQGRHRPSGSQYRIRGRVWFNYRLLSDSNPLGGRPRISPDPCFFELFLVPLLIDWMRAQRDHNECSRNTGYSTDAASDAATPFAADLSPGHGARTRRRPRASLIWPKTGSTIVFRRAYCSRTNSVPAWRASSPWASRATRRLVGCRRRTPGSAAQRSFTM